MPIGTGANGINPAGDISVYAAGNVTVIDRGTSMVSYGPWLTLNPGDPFPGTGLIVYEIQSGQMQADNQVFIRTVTVTPAA